MQPLARKALAACGFLLMLAGVFGYSFLYHHDHRTAESLSAYCRIDFQSSHTESGALEGATLTLWDSRYDTAKLLPQAVLYTDGDAWEMVAAVKQSPAPGEANAHEPQSHPERRDRPLPLLLRRRPDHRPAAQRAGSRVLEGAAAMMPQDGRRGTGSRSDTNICPPGWSSSAWRASRNRRTSSPRISSESASIRPARRKKGLPHEGSPTIPREIFPNQVWQRNHCVRQPFSTA